MADKYVGAIVGRRTGAAASSAPGDAALTHTDAPDLEEAAASSSVSELLIAADGSVFGAVLESDGSVSWRPVPDAARAVAVQASASQMSSMLKDTHRNAVYAAAIRNTIAEVAKKLGRPPRVIDIGAGTGLLSMMAAAVGAQSVVAVEQWKLMADIAAHVTKDNAARVAAPVRVVAARSDDAETLALRDAPVGDSAGGKDTWLPADVVVSELLDSALMGEGVVPTLRHAVRHGLVDVNAATAGRAAVPYRAIVHAQLVYHPTLSALQQTDSTAVGTADDESSTKVGLTRQDWADEGAEAPTCAVCPRAIPMHLRMLQPQLRAVSDVFDAAEVQFDCNTLQSADERVQQVYKTNVRLRADARGQANAVVFWWTLILWEPDAGVSAGAQPADSAAESADGIPICSKPPTKPHESAITYSTSPSAVPTQGYQDHWSQCVWPLNADITATPGAEWTVVTEITDLDVAFHVRARATEAVLVWPSKRVLNKGARAGDAAAVVASLVDDDGCVEAQQRIVFLEREQCTCGLHAVCNPERLWMLNTPAYVETLARASAALTARLPATDALAILSLGDLHAASLPVGRYLEAANQAVHVVAAARSIPHATLATCLAQQAGWHIMDLEDDESDASDADEEYETMQRFTAVTVQTGQLADSGLCQAALERAGAPSFHAVMAEPYFEHLHAQPLWTLCCLWNQITQLRRAGQLEADAALMPARAIVRAQAIDFSDALAMHGQVGEVHGFDHTKFDAVEAHWRDALYTYPMWQYNFVPLSETATVLDAALGDDSPFAGDPASNDVSVAEVRLRLHSPLHSSPARPAVMCWVDYDCAGDGTLILHGGLQASAAATVSAGSRAAAAFEPSPFRQHIRFFDLPPSNSVAIDINVELRFVDGRPDIQVATAAACTSVEV